MIRIDRFVREDVTINNRGMDMNFGQRKVDDGTFLGIVNDTA